MGRLVGSDFKKTTLETWKRIIPGNEYRIREQSSEIVIRDTIKIIYGGLDSQQAVNKFNSAELAFIFVDQAEETNQKDVAVLEGSRRLTYKGLRPPYKTLYTANPAECWLHRDFVKGQRAGSKFVPALPTDNPYLPDGYIAQLEKSFGFDKGLLAAYRDGDWETLSGTRKLFTLTMIQQCFTNVNFIDNKDLRVVACDPAYFGDDKTVIRWCKNEETYDHDTGKIYKESYGKVEPMDTVGRMLYWGEMLGGNVLYVVDDTNIQGIGSRLAEMGKNVLRVNFASKASDEAYKNKRAEMHLRAAQWVRNKRIEIAEDDIALQDDLAVIEYDYKQGRFFIPPKDEIKKKIGRSPNDSDAFILMIEGLEWLHTSEGYQEYMNRMEVAKPRWAREQVDEEFVESAMPQGELYY